MRYKGVYKNDPYYGVQGVGVYLGSKCNQDCLYCRDKAFRKHPEVTKDSVSRLLKFLDTLIGLRGITLVGGEPFLYTDYLKYFYDYADSRKLTIHFITNSLGLQEDSIWDTFIKDRRNIHIQVSYDGSNNSRGYTILDNKKVRERCSTLIAESRFSVCSVITKDSWNVVSIFSDFLNSFGNVSFNWMISPLLESAGCEELNRETPIDDFLYSFYQFLNTYKWSGLARYVLLKYLRSMDYHIGKEELFLEMNGSIIRSCFDYTPIGRWDKGDIPKIFNKSNYLSLNSSSPNCSGCMINELCIKRPEFFSPTSCQMRVGMEECIFSIIRESGCSTLEEFEGMLHELQ